jgi:hypothetical protein
MLGWSNPSQGDAKILLQRWHEIFGPVDFADPQFFRAMCLLGPQPDSVFLPLEDKGGGGWVKTLGWANMFFRKEYAFSQREKVNAPRGIGVTEVFVRKPVKKFYLAKGDEADLLWYSWTAQGVQIRVMESLIMVLVRLRPHGFDPQKGIERRNLEKLLLDVL